MSLRQEYAKLLVQNDTYLVKFSSLSAKVKYEISVYLALQAIPCLECITSCYTSLYDVQRITEMQDVKTLEKPRLATTQVSPF